MTAVRDHRDFLNDMVTACRSIIRFTEGMTLDDYLADEKTRYAVMRAYEILGEAVRHLPEPLKLANPDVILAKGLISDLRAHTHDAIEAMLAPSLRTGQTRSALAGMAGMLPPGEPKSIEVGIDSVVTFQSLTGDRKRSRPGSRANRKTPRSRD